MNSVLVKLDELRMAIEHNYGVPVIDFGNIGIGITTHNRYEVFSHTLKKIREFSPGFKIEVVDDASKVPVPEATFRFDTNVGIAVAKNKCFELLEDCDHIFLFDDDTYPLVDGWHLPYVNSVEPHLMYIFADFHGPRKLNDTSLLYKDSSIKAYSHPRGCMCYFKKVCLEKVGGMDPVFGRWGWEHPDLSNRIFNAGLTSFRYMDVNTDTQLIYSGDEHEVVKSTVLGNDRAQQIRRNAPLYEARKDSTEYVPYKRKQDILLTSYFTGVPDPQRGAKWSFSTDTIAPLLKSLKGANLVVLNDFGKNEVEGTVTYRSVETHINPYFQRWVSYRQYLIANQGSLGKVFCLDATDVELLRDPFKHMQKGILYTGDEVDTVGCEWLRKHHQNPELVKFIDANAGKQLLNAGLLGGDVDTVIEFAKYMIDFYASAESQAFYEKKPGAGMTDMGAFNYVAYTKFGDRLKHGLEVNTPFKANQVNGLSWFKHK